MRPACLLRLPWSAMDSAPARAGLNIPTKAITIAPALAPGTGLDTVARVYGEAAQSLGRPVVFDNRPGANGIVAVSALRNMPADGHAVGTSGPLGELVDPTGRSAV